MPWGFETSTAPQDNNEGLDKMDMPHSVLQATFACERQWLRRGVALAFQPPQKYLKVGVTGPSFGDASGMSLEERGPAFSLLDNGEGSLPYRLGVGPAVYSPMCKRLKYTHVCINLQRMSSADLESHGPSGSPPESGLGYVVDFSLGGPTGCMRHAALKVVQDHGNNAIQPPELMCL
ncbi:hypothetical protein BO78DRAFT_421173 [Aspergillus sclerotiicarbonarius CBS 121057]|uniref:Uncharacterized protein n=1 Tax=Aspergillus sclerotiicarbonarius (strain CBS 121057 / IBT 28362) TaxID=1448318 RepID=A0A319E1I6_ASPSB|nr:hypothetical protein BO78DRAFT_421173 [Aspergillus sclerotiicarbonarius CBS 121057]